jgi:hypothetical protein
VFYGIAVLFIAYFFWDTFSLCNELTTNEVLTKEMPQNTELLTDYFPYSKQQDFTVTVGTQIWKIFINIMQILFLVMFMLMLYIGERLEKWNSKH